MILPRRVAPPDRNCGVRRCVLMLERGAMRKTFAAASFLLLALPLAAQSDADFAAWARSRIVPIDSEGQTFRALDAAIADVRLIGVGESVHEADPFLTFRFQLLQDLVRRHRVTALVLESGLPEAMALDDYVRGRTATVDYNATLPGGFGELDEIRRTMEWLRTWNQGPGRKRPVGVYGADLPARSGSMTPALDRLETFLTGDLVVKGLIDSIRPVAAQISAGWWRGAAQKYEALPADTRATLSQDVSLLVQRVNHLTGVEKDRLEWARRLALLIHEHEAGLRLGAFSPTAPRDIALAENTLWVLGRLGKGERAVYWAHNAHVQRVPVKGPALPPGRFVASGMRFDVALGKQYFAIGTTYGGPSMDDQTPAASGSVDATLESIGHGPYMLLLSGARDFPAVNAWLAQERAMRFQVGYLTLPLGPAFDAVVYFDRASRTARTSR
jgi:erythromycin esterase